MITVSFSPHCTGWEREKAHLRPCVCDRCLIQRGEEPDEHTRLIARVSSYIQKFELDNSVNKIVSKTVEKKVSWALSDIKNLITQLNTIIDEQNNPNNKVVEGC